MYQVRVDGVAMYEIRCIFCKRMHRSEFFDDIEEEILRCRDTAPGWQKGLLSEFEESRIITVETAANINQEDPLNLGAGGP